MSKNHILFSVLVLSSLAAHGTSQQNTRGYEAKRAAIIKKNNALLSEKGKIGRYPLYGANEQERCNNIGKLFNRNNRIKVGLFAPQGPADLAQTIAFTQNSNCLGRNPNIMNNILKKLEQSMKYIAKTQELLQKKK